MPEQKKYTSNRHALEACLIKHGALNEYRENTVAEHGIFDVDRRFDHADMDAAFLWAKTEQGHKYWYRIHLDFEAGYLGK